ncbi:MAG TPA: iron-containing alcohol dehydrogenase [Spirochaetia bacterium]|nr:iron-containing alcohol dehydrogenase [Spirochaetia bacterium]
MANFIFEDFLSRFDSRGGFSCACGRVHTLATRNVIVGVGALQEGASLVVRERGPGATVWVLSDENTERAAGERWKSHLGAARVLSRILPGHPRPVPSAELVDELTKEVRAAAPDLIVSVGSGVISDVGKKVSRETGVANWCVATAASVDAFTSATSSIHVGGFHNAVPAAVSETVICDLDVIEKAPREMTLAGLGDLLAKLIANLDWNLSRIMTGEHVCQVIAGFARESARAALSAARSMRSDPKEAARTLTDAVLTSGFAMQAIGNSRPAASAEHTVAHFWEIADAAPVERLDLHGILVGIASRMILHGYLVFYRSFADLTLDAAERLRAFEAERPWEESLEAGLRPFAEKVRSEMARRRFDRETLSERLKRFEASRQAILDLALPALDELGSAVEVLSGLDYPFSPRQPGISTENCLLPFRNVRLLRSRYSGFDLAYELGLERLIYEEIKSDILVEIR